MDSHRPVKHAILHGAPQIVRSPSQGTRPQHPRVAEATKSQHPRLRISTPTPIAMGRSQRPKPTTSIYRGLLFHKKSARQPPHPRRHHHRSPWRHTHRGMDPTRSLRPEPTLPSRDKEHRQNKRLGHRHAIPSAHGTRHPLHHPRLPMVSGRKQLRHQRHPICRQV